MENIGKKRTNVRRTKCESETECNSNGPTAVKKGRVHCQPLTWPGINYSLNQQKSLSDLETAITT